jgi:phosphoribosylformylglycinamidine cyclo-ligase
MELYVAPKVADDIIKISKSYNVDAQIIGRVEKLDVDTSSQPSRKLTISSDYGTFGY